MIQTCNFRKSFESDKAVYCSRKISYIAGVGRDRYAVLNGECDGEDNCVFFQIYKNLASIKK